MLSYIRDNVAQHTRDTLSQMDTITSSSKASKASFDIDEWIVNVVWETSRSIEGASGDEEVSTDKICK